MHLQKTKFRNTDPFWLVLDDNYLPIKPIKEFLLYLKNINNNRVNSIRAYAHHLKLYWEYLASIKKDWQQINYSELANFIQWLRYSNDVKSSHETVAKRQESTINTILSAVSSFYNFQQKLGATTITLTTEKSLSSCTYRTLLDYIKRTKAARGRLIKVKQPKKIPKTLTREQIQKIKNYCTTLRDKFLISLLHETGLRIGQALGLHHEDIVSWENEIIVRYRNNNSNGACSKSCNDNIVHASHKLMELYADYVVSECSDIKSDFVFVSFQSQHRGKPYTYSATQALFRRLSEKSGIHITPHQYRHTHASELIQAGWDSTYVQKRLGHSSVQTTIDQYTHLTDGDLKAAFKKYQKRKTMGEAS